MFCNEHPSLILFKANWCGYCRDFLPVFERVADWLEQEHAAHSFVFEQTNEDDALVIKRFGISGYPTIMLHKCQLPEEQSYILYTGPRTFVDITKFIQLHVRSPMATSVPGFKTEFIPLVGK